MLLLAGALTATLVACGGESAEGYGGEFRDGFLASCNAAVGEGKEPVCECTYDRLEETVPFERADRLDQRLQDSPERALPDDIAELISGCVAASVPPSISTTTSSTSTTAPAAGTDTTAADGSTTTTTAEAG